MEKNSGQGNYDKSWSSHTCHWTENANQEEICASSRACTIEGMIIGLKVSAEPHYPFKRLAMVEGDEGYAEYDVSGNFLGDGSEYSMVDTGQPRPPLLSEMSKSSLGNSSHSSSSSSDWFGALGGGGRGGGSKAHGRYRHLLHLKKSHHKQEQQKSWDIFPGIPGVDLLDGTSQPQPQPQPSALLAFFSNADDPVRQPKGGKRNDNAQQDICLSKSPQSPGFNDKLAATFDFQDEQHDMDDTAYSESGDASRLSSEFSHENEEPNCCGRADDLNLVVKATSNLQVYRFKGLVFVNEYALVTSLGRGSFGEVKLALNTQDMEVYALKLIPRALRHKAHQRGGQVPMPEEHVMSEINVMKKLSHPNIVRLVEVIDDPSKQKVLMVMEYVEGGSLLAGTRIAPKKRLSELAARKYFRDILQGLSYLHSHKIAHGDLKPDNFLLSTKGHLKIADFGSSQLTRVGHLVRRTSGTPAFMAPEVCAGRPYRAKRADIWALGVCLYMFVFGSVPYKARTTAALYEEICHAPLVFPADIFVSGSIKHLLAMLLDKDPEARISLNGVMCHPWVTHNGLNPIPGFFGRDKQIEEDLDSYLLESWPDDPAEAGLGFAMKGMGNLFAGITFSEGEILVQEGEAHGIFYYLEEGVVEISRVEPRSSELSDEDEDDQPATPTLKGKWILQIMHAAAIDAGKYVTAVRQYSDDKVIFKATRGPGCIVGDVGLYGSTAAKWRYTVQAKSRVRAVQINYEILSQRIAARPEVEVDIRAVMAQRKGELLKIGILEKLASLREQLGLYLQSLD